MSLRGCFCCLKVFVFVVNFLFWLLGLVVMAASLWLLFDQKLYLQHIGDDHTNYYAGTYIILATGGIMTLVGFLGCCGAWKESTWMLGTFFLFLLIIFLGEIALGVLIYFREAPYEQIIKKSVEGTVIRKYHNNSSVTRETFDLIQEGLHCCGADGPADWQRSVFNLHPKLDEVKEIGIGTNVRQTSSDVRTFNIPEACCIDRENEYKCQQIVSSVTANNLPTGQIYNKGCTGELTVFLEAQLVYMIAMAGGVLVIEVVGMIFSICLCCALKRIEDFKA